MSKLKELGSKMKSDKVFGNWSVKNINFYFKKDQNVIGECITLHRIRVLRDLTLINISLKIYRYNYQ